MVECFVQNIVLSLSIQQDNLTSSKWDTLAGVRFFWHSLTNVLAVNFFDYNKWQTTNNNNILLTCLCNLNCFIIFPHFIAISLSLSLSLSLSQSSLLLQLTWILLFSTIKWFSFVMGHNKTEMTVSQNLIEIIKLAN